MAVKETTIDDLLKKLLLLKSKHGGDALVVIDYSDAGGSYGSDPEAYAGAMWDEKIKRVVIFDDH